MGPSACRSKMEQALPPQVITTDGPRSLWRGPAAAPRDAWGILILALWRAVPVAEASFQRSCGTSLLPALSGSALGVLTLRKECGKLCSGRYFGGVILGAGAATCT